MIYRPGDRVRFETTGDDGWPLIRYGFVGGVSGNGGPVVVMARGYVGDRRLISLLGSGGP